jgi:hypothetical protein
MKGILEREEEDRGNYQKLYIFSGYHDVYSPNCSLLSVLTSAMSHSCKQEPSSQKIFKAEQLVPHNIEDGCLHGSGRSNVML